MKAGDEDLNYSVRPIEVDNIDGDGEFNGDVALKMEGGDGGCSTFWVYLVGNF